MTRRLNIGGGNRYLYQFVYSNRIYPAVVYIGILYAWSSSICPPHSSSIEAGCSTSQRLMSSGDTHPENFRIAHILDGNPRSSRSSLRLYLGIHRGTYNFRSGNRGYDPDSSNWDTLSFIRTSKSYRDIRILFRVRIGRWVKKYLIFFRWADKLLLQSSSSWYW